MKVRGNMAIKPALKNSKGITSVRVKREEIDPRIQKQSILL